MPGHLAMAVGSTLWGLSKEEQSCSWLCSEAVAIATAQGESETPGTLLMVKEVSQKGIHPCPNPSRGVPFFLMYPPRLLWSFVYGVEFCSFIGIILLSTWGNSPHISILGRARPFLIVWSWEERPKCRTEETELDLWQRHLIMRSLKKNKEFTKTQEHPVEESSNSGKTKLQKSIELSCVTLIASATSMTN